MTINNDTARIFSNRRQMHDQAQKIDQECKMLNNKVYLQIIVTNFKLVATAQLRATEGFAFV